jgi:NTE family protein
MSAKPKIAIACQGGGSQTAFTAGVLKTLFEHRIQDRVEILSISGTSGGAICASMIWYALQKGENPVWKRLIDFWNDNTARTPQERFFNDFVIKSAELTGKGLLPQFNISPYSPLAKQWLEAATRGIRDDFTDLQKLLEKHLDFAELKSWGARENRPILLLGACNVLSGKLWKFNSRVEAIEVKKILASCAIPNIFPAVEIGADAYWDGIFSDNPPVDELIDPLFVGNDNIPNEIWIIKINPTERATIPKRADDILDRRNELEGNVSLFQDIRKIERLNYLLMNGAFKEEFLDRYYIKEPIKVPKLFAIEEDQPYHIPWIEMSKEFSDTLNYESKLDRSPDNIQGLMRDGEQQARKFLSSRFGD